ncbi:predicted protein [Streptomyces sp. C]|nr:predicted protein [Streptomyces sp. C]
MTSGAASRASGTVVPEALRPRIHSGQLETWLTSSPRTVAGDGLTAPIREAPGRHWAGPSVHDALDGRDVTRLACGDAEDQGLGCCQMPSQAQSETL